MPERITPPASRHTCVRCEATFSVTSAEVCPRTCDGGPHESRSIHPFRPGRLDGLCAEPTEGELMCGFAKEDDFIHA